MVGIFIFNLLWGCVPKSTHFQYSIKIVLTGMPSDTTSFYLYGLTDFSLLSETRPINGVVVFKGKAERAFTARIQTKEQQYLTLWIDQANIVIEGDYRDLFYAIPTNISNVYSLRVNKDTHDLYKNRSLVRVEDYGAIPNDTIDDWAAISEAMRHHDAIQIGDHVSDTFLLSRPLSIAANLVIHGYVKVMGGPKKMLMQDVLPSDYYALVEDAEYHFSKFQQLVLIDDQSLVLSGREPYGEAITVEQVNGDTIFFDGPITRQSYLVGRHAFIGYNQSVLIGKNLKDKFIAGTGILDGNRSDMIDFHPFFKDTTRNLGEDITFGSCIGIDGFDGLTVEGITCINAQLHGAAFFEGKNLNIKHCSFVNNFDKNCVVAFSENITVRQSIFSESLWEDGLAIYRQANRVTVDSCFFVNNHRYGIWSLDNEDIHVSHIKSHDNKCGIVSSGSNRVYYRQADVVGGGTNRLSQSRYQVEISRSNHVHFLNVNLSSPDNGHGAFYGKETYDFSWQGGHIADLRDGKGRALTFDKDSGYYQFKDLQIVNVKDPVAQFSNAAIQMDNVYFDVEPNWGDPIERIGFWDKMQNYAQRAISLIF